MKNLNRRHIAFVLITIVFFGIVWGLYKVGLKNNAEWALGASGGLVFSSLFILFFDKPVERLLQNKDKIIYRLSIVSIMIGVVGCLAIMIIFPILSSIHIKLYPIINITLGAFFSIGAVGFVLLAQYTKVGD